MDILRTLALTHSYTRAARTLHLSQSAVYLQVRKIEEEIGLAVTEQMGKKVFLTKAGEEILAASQRIHGTLEQLSRALEHLRRLDDGQLRIAVTSAANAFAVDLIARFLQQHPQLQVILNIANRQEVLASLERNDIDMAIMGEPPQTLGLVAMPFHRNDLIVIAAASHPLRHELNIPLQRIAEEPFVLRELGSGTREAILRFFGERGLQLRQSLVMNSNEAIKQAVKVGMGLAVVARHSVIVKMESGYLCSLSVDGFPLRRAWHLVHRKGKQLAPAPREFKTFLIEHQYVQHTDGAEELL
ncbi:LysR substrate-binding domain-containing protein [Acidithiobacillus caldus]|uniref:LysR substrate-binding domain-containing protein n=1 Tax=Acidithiobacillus caldus TaxID=33059 RepID=UPI001D02A085|nr:LysR substrate-binding domain-containing protein [Acidithiobacillus caldus]